MTDSARPFPILHLAAFDHRRSLDRALGALDAAEGRQLDRLAAKELIWRGVQRTLGVTEHAAVLTDAETGSVLDAARAAGVTTAMALERSGQRWLEPERSPVQSQQLLLEHRPDFGKLLVRWHPSDPLDRQLAQVSAMIELQHQIVDAGSRLMLELLIPADGPDAAFGETEPDAYHDEILPVRLADSIRQLSDANIIPAMWKIDGLARAAACAHVGAAVTAGSDGQAGIVVLGAGKDLATVTGWFRATARQPEFSGFAIGRTIWWEAVRGFVTGELSTDEAEAMIGNQFAELVIAYQEAVGQALPTN